jgi:hypothetical protein
VYKNKTFEGCSPFTKFFNIFFWDKSLKVKPYFPFQCILSVVFIETNCGDATHILNHKNAIFVTVPPHLSNL